jgi:hypothetical protein
VAYVLIGHKSQPDEDNGAKKEKEKVNITDRSCASTPTAPKRCKTRIPELTRPNIVCLLSKNGVGPSVIKNCEPRRAEQKITRARATSSVSHAVVNQRKKRRGWVARASERANERTVGVWSRVGHCEDSGTCEPQFWMDLVFAASGMNRWMMDCG